jgi:HAD superfamily hydrolase (TIGR01549 family)
LISQETDFLEEIDKIIARHNIEVIFPSTDYELDLLSKNKQLFENSGAKIAISDANLIDILINKIKTYHFLKSHGFPLLDSADPQSQEIVYPIIGKPAYGFGSKGIIILRNREDLRQAKQSIKISDYIWMPFIEEFDEFSCDFAISFGGEISSIVIRKRIRTSGGFAVITQFTRSENIQRQVALFANLLMENGGCGIFNVQVIRYNYGCLHFSDINPRVGTSSVFTLGTGVNLPLFMCLTFTKSLEALPKNPAAQGRIKMVRNISEKWITVMPSGKIKGFVFDLDDTLIDQKVWIFDKLNITYDQHARQLPDKETFMLAAYQFIEEGQRSTLIDDLKTKFQLSEQLRTEMIQSYRQALPECIRVFRDVAHNLANLKRLGFKLGLLTDNPVQSQKQKVNMLDFQHYFDVILYSREFGKEKPDKFLFEKMALELGFDIDKLAMVGDNLYRDCIGALTAGCQAAFLIERKGSFFNFNFSYFSKMITLPMEKIVRITSLNDLYYGFEENTP